MLNALMAIQNQLLGEASRQWGGLAKEMHRARSEYARLRLEASRTIGTRRDPDMGPLADGQETANRQDAWNSVNGGPV